MPVPTSIADLSKNAADNSPAGTESAKGTIDDYFRAAFAFIKQLADLAGGQSVTLSSASTVNIGFAATLNIVINGTTTITAFDNWAEGTMRWVTFNGALTLTHSGALQLPGASSIQTTAGDVAVFKSLGGGNWKCMAYQRISGVPLIAYLPLTGGTLLGQLLVKEGTAAEPGLSFANDGAPDTGFYHISDGVFGISCNGVQTFGFGPDKTTTYRPLRVEATSVNPYYTAEFVNANGPMRCLLQGSGQNGLKHISLENGVLRVSNSANTTPILTLTDDGNLSAPIVTETSDGRLKKLWRRLAPDLLQNVAALKKVGTFVWRKGGMMGMGGCAQEIEKFMPWAVVTDENGFKSVRYGAAAFVIVVELTRAFLVHVAKTEKRLAKLEGK